jgi:CHAT domain-containing protein
MDNDLFLQHLRELSLEDGKAYIQEHIEELTDHVAVGVLIAEEALRQRGIDPFVSLKLAELMVFFGDYIHHDLSHALGLKAKGDALCFLGHHQTALECLDAAGQKFLHLGDEVNWARTRMSWIHSCAWLGSTEEALQGATRAREVFLQHGEHYWVCAVDINTAMIYTQIGQYEKALELYERILPIYPTLPGQNGTSISRSIGMIENNQARNLSWLGNFEQAYRLFRQAQARFTALGETSTVINIETNLADLDYAQGYYGSALRRYYQARDGLEQNNLEVPDLLAWIKLRMAVCLVKLNRAQEACQLAAEAVKVYRQLGASLDIGDALCEYATTLAASGRLKDALAALDEAWTILTHGGFDHYASTTRLQHAELLLKIGSVNEAYDEARLIKEYFDTHGLIASSIRASLVMVEALIKRTQQAEIQQTDGQQLRNVGTTLAVARALCEQVSHLAREYNLQEQAYKSQHLLGRLAAIQGNYSKAVRHYRAAIAQIERILENLVYDLSPSFLHTAWTVYEDMIALCLQQSQSERAFSYLERARSTALRQYLNAPKTSQEESALQARSAFVLQTQHELEVWKEKYHEYSSQLADMSTSISPSVDRETIHAELKRCEAKLNEVFERLHLQQLDTRVASQKSKRATRNVQRVDIAQLQQFLEPGQLLLAYYLFQGRLIIFAITTEHLITYENPGGAAQLERLLPLLHAYLEPDGWPDPQQPPQKPVRRLLNKLYDVLVAPVEALLPDTSGYLTIVPYGPLHKLPFHALNNGSHFLIEDYQVNYLPASSILPHLGTHRINPTGTAQADGLTRPPLVLGYSGRGYLQRVLDEARAVAASLGGHCYLEGEATITRLVEQAPGSPIIHLATHGKSRLDTPNFSYVQLADGQLNAIDAFSLNLDRCELVTLSGCETGLALSGGGDEQLGLGRAFLAAGAASLVMSLWPVEDNATNELMQLFYQNLLQGDSKMQALRAAQCSFLKGTSSIHTHPYFWASFRLVGDAGPLHFEKPHEHSLTIETELLKK